MSRSHSQVIIVGAGLAGLCCARRLHQGNVPFLLLEASDGVGGRVRTDRVDGFWLDRGFQVLQTAYPEPRQVLDYQALRLYPFSPGALVFFQGRLHRVVDPIRQPRYLLQTMLAPVGTFADKLRLARFRRRVCKGSWEELFRRPETSTLEALQAEGFSGSMIERFFRPFFSGVFFEKDLASSSRMFEFIFRVLAQGDTALPANGMGAIPAQLAASLPPESIRLRAKVAEILEDGVRLDTGEEIMGTPVVLATDGKEAARLLGDTRMVDTVGCCCLYFSTDRPPVREPILVLDGEGQGPVTNLGVLSQVAPSYAPPGASLIHATVVGLPPIPDSELEGQVRSQVRQWFGAEVSRWQHLRTYRIREALPDQRPPTPDPVTRPVKLRPGLYQCGEYGGLSSLHWAMVSGRRAAEAVIHDLGGSY